MLCVSRGAQVYVLPLQRTQFLRARSGEKGQDDVVVHSVGNGCGQDGVDLLRRQGFRGPAVAARRQLGQVNHVALHPVSRSCSPNRSIEAGMGAPKSLCAERLRELAEPRLDFPGRKVTKLASTEERDDVL